MGEAELAKELKVFRKQFKKDHGRDPSRRDMNKHPEIAATYDAWLAIKSSQTASSSKLTTTTSAKTALTTKRKALPDDSPQKRALSQVVTAMGPPPTTPNKKKKTVTYANSFLTPTKNTKRNEASSPAKSGGSSVHDSGGSIVDVPLTPNQNLRSPSLNRQSQQQRPHNPSSPSPRGRTYEEANSPSKLRALLSSFSSIHRTPNKGRAGEEKDDDDDELMEKLSRSVGMPAYTPRTKARKRLRGEVVITPEKMRAEKLQNEGADDVNAGNRSQKLMNEQEPLRKKRRGMVTHTLKDFGILPVAGVKSREVNSREKEQILRGRMKQIKPHQSDMDMGECDDEEEDEILGPSPSVNRVVDRQVKSFRPLFGVDTNGSLSDDEVNRREEAIPDDEERSDHEAGDGLSSKNAKMGSDFDSEDEKVVVVPYQRYVHRKGANSKAVAFDDDDDDGRDDDMAFYELATALRRTSPSRVAEEAVSSDSEDEGPPILDSLSLNSPQCKKARTHLRIKAEKDIRQLLGAEEEIQALDLEAEDEKQGLGAAVPPKTNKVGPPIKGGKLRKGFKDIKSTISTGKKAETVASRRAKQSTSLIFQNTRDQIGSDQDSDYAQSDDNKDDDEWASDISSAEYGLGNGYMSDNDDI